MQGGLGQSAASAGRVGVVGRYGRAAVLLSGLALSGCVSPGQIANLTETRRATVALESLDGPPPAVFHRFVKSLESEAGARRIAVVAPNEANYRLRGYIAARGGHGATSSVAWAMDVYDAGQRRAFQLSGVEKSAGRSWASADDQVIERIARAGMEQFAAFAAAPRPTPAPVAALLPSERAASAFSWLDDWTPEASGIFRILRRAPSRPELAANAQPHGSPDNIPLPRDRPAPSAATSTAALGFARED